jgi:hypothetical protein
MDANVSYIANGAYLATYTPKRSGTYTVATMLGTRFEVQNLTVSWPSVAARGGYFVLSYGACNNWSPCIYTKKLSFDSGAAAVQQAIEALPGVGDVTVSYTQSSDYLSSAWTVTYLTACDKLPLVVTDSSFILNVTAVVQGECSHISTSSNGSLSYPFVNSVLIEEVQQLSIDFTSCGLALSSCTFEMSYRGYTTAPVAYNALSLQIEAALEALPSVGTVSVSSTYSASVSTFTVTFKPTSGYSVAHIEMFGDLPSILLTDSTGVISPASMTNTEITKGTSPFASVVVAETITAVTCTAVDSMGVAGQNGLSTGIYQDLTSFRVESRDAYSNRVLLGPVREVQIVEVFSNASTNISGSFSVSYGDKTVTLAVGVGLDDFQAALQSSLFLGAIEVSTTAAATSTSLQADVTFGAFVVSFSTDPSTIFKVGGWIRFANNVTGDVLTVSAVDPLTKTVTLNKPYPGRLIHSRALHTCHTMLQ